jgi:Tol biopolymer transport system component
MGAAGEQPHKLFTAEKASEIWSVNWSPDGRRLAYLKFHPTPDKIEASVETRDIGGGSRTVIVPDAGSDGFLRNFCWLADGRIIYSLDEALPLEKSSNLWEVRVDSRTGKAASEPRKITHWAGFLVDNLSATGDGKRVTFARGSDQNITLVGELEGNGRRLRPPRRLTLSDAMDFPGDWTADSKAILFQSDRNGNVEIFKQAPDQESADLIVGGPEEYLDPRLSPDGTWLLYAVLPKGANPFPTARLMRVRMSGGPPELVLEARGWFYHSCSTHPGGLCVVAERTPDGKFVFTSFDPLKGRGPEVTTIDTIPLGWNLSPDGSRLAVVTGKGDPTNRIQIFSVPGGALRELTVPGWTGFGNLNWLADGKAMIISNEALHGSTLLYVDLEGHAHPVWQQRASVGPYAVASRDGRYLAISADAKNSNIWMLENF